MLRSMVAAQAATYDLAIRTADISFSKTELIAGERVRIYARVRNEGTSDVSGYITFYQSDQLIGDSQVVTVRAGGVDEEVWVDFTVPDGAFNIRAEIKGTEPADQNTQNNVAVGAMQFPKKDTDRDGTIDDRDEDDDNDGLTDTEEAALSSDPLKSDTDGDGTNDKLDAFPTDPSRQTVPPPQPTPVPPPPPPSAEILNSKELNTKQISNSNTQITKTAVAVAAVATNTPEPEPPPAVEVTTERTTTPPIASLTVERERWNTFRFTARSRTDQKIAVRWNFGDGVTSNAESVSHRFPGPGDYEVTLEVANEAGELARDSVKISISFYNFGNWRLWGLFALLIAFAVTLVVTSRSLSLVKRG